MWLYGLHKGVSSSALKAIIYFVDLQYSDTICYTGLIMKLFPRLLSAQGMWNHICFLGKDDHDQHFYPCVCPPTA